MERSNPSAWWRQLLWQPLTWGVTCLAIALPSFLAGPDTSMVPPILAIIGGGLCGMGIHTLILGIRSPLRAVIVHIVVAATFALALYGLVEGGKETLRALPDLARGTLFVLGLAGCPAAAWLWMALFARVLAVRWRKRAKPAPAPVPVPKWKLSDEAAVLSFTGIPMRMRTLTLWIGAIALLLAVAGSFTLIALDVVVARLGPRLAVVLVFGLYGVPGYFIVSRAIRSRTMPCVVRFKQDRMRIEWGSHYLDYPYEEIRMLRWRCDSDYARVEIRGRHRTTSLMRGFTDPRRGPARQLPELPDRVLDWLAHAGLGGAAPRLHKLTTLRR